MCVIPSRATPHPRRGRSTPCSTSRGAIIPARPTGTHGCRITLVRRTGAGHGGSVDAALTVRSKLRARGYVLILVKDVALVGELARALEAGGPSAGDWDTLARAFERTIQTCELLVTYAVAVAGKPSTH